MQTCKLKKIITISISVLIVLVLILAMSACGGEWKYEWSTVTNDDGSSTITEIRTLSGFGTPPEELNIPTEYDGKQISGFAPEYVEQMINSAVTSLTVPEGIKTVDLGAISSAFNSLKSLSLPSTIESITGGRINGDLDIKFESNAYIEFSGNCFVEKSTQTLICALNNCEIPDGIKAIASEALWFKKIAVFRLPESLERIEQSAFYGAEFTSQVDITLGSNIKYVGYGAFVGMNINTLKISTNGIISENAFCPPATSLITKINTIIFDVVPNVELGTRIYLSGGKNLTLTYYYENDDIQRSEPCWHLEIESDISGYKKYDPNVTGNEKGTSFISFRVSAS